MRKSRYIAAITAVCANFTLVSCSNDASNESDASNEKAVKANSQAEETKSGTVDNAGEQPVSSNMGPPVTASHNAGGGLRTDLNEVTISSAVTTVVFMAVNTKKLSEDPFINGRLDDGTDRVSVSDKGDTKEGKGKQFTTDGMRLVEGKHVEVYRAVYDTSGGYLCSMELAQVSIRGGGSVVLQTIFAELPKDVMTVDVTIPEVGVFKKVKMSR